VCRLQCLTLPALLLLDKRDIILGYALLFALLCAANAVYIVAVGRIGPRFTKLRPGAKVLSYSSRLVVAALYLAGAIGVALVVWQGTRKP
jgi:hypothetical protein